MIKAENHFKQAGILDSSLDMVTRDEEDPFFAANVSQFT